MVDLSLISSQGAVRKVTRLVTMFDLLLISSRRAVRKKRKLDKRLDDKRCIDVH
jgi:hypothetical protein